MNMGSQLSTPHVGPGPLCVREQRWGILPEPVGPGVCRSRLDGRACGSQQEGDFL